MNAKIPLKSSVSGGLGAACNCRISGNADISTVHCQSTRGTYSKIILYRMHSLFYSSNLRATLSNRILPNWIRRTRAIILKDYCPQSINKKQNYQIKTVTKQGLKNNFQTIYVVSICNLSEKVNSFFNNYGCNQ